MEVGEKKYRLTLVEKRNGKSLFVCDCGMKKEVEVYLVKKGNNQSCGCLGKERRLEANTTHGMSKRNSEHYHAYSSWQHMKERCLNKENVYYSNYGGRGIKVCDRWLKFEYFLEDMGVGGKEYTLERIDNNGNYCKENCRWATFVEQMNNTRRTRWIEFNGKKQSLMMWSRELNKKYSLIRSRLDRGWSVERALTH